MKIKISPEYKNSLFLASIKMLSGIEIPSDSEIEVGSEDILVNSLFDDEIRVYYYFSHNYDHNYRAILKLDVIENRGCDIRYFLVYRDDKVYIVKNSLALLARIGKITGKLKDRANKKARSLLGL